MSNRRNGEFFLPNQVSDTNTVDALNDAVNTLAVVCGGKYEPDYLYAGNFRVGEGGVELSVSGKNVPISEATNNRKFTFSDGNVPVVIMLGQSNTDGRGTATEVSGLSGYDFTDKVKIYNKPIIRNPANVTINHNSDGVWEDLSIGNSQVVSPVDANGIGPEFGIATKWVDEVYGSNPTPLYIIKCAVGGTSIYPNATSVDNNWSNAADQLRELAIVNIINPAIRDLKSQGLNPKIIGLVWGQGESDADNSTSANSYESNLRSMLDDIISRCGMSGVRVLGMGLSDYDGGEDWTTVKSAQDAVYNSSTAYDNSRLIVTDSSTDLQPLNRYPTGVGAGDIHYTSIGCMNLGERYFNALDTVGVDISGDQIFQLYGDGEKLSDDYVDVSNSGGLFIRGDYTNAGGNTKAMAWVQDASTPVRAIFDALPRPAILMVDSESDIEVVYSLAMFSELGTNKPCVVLRGSYVSGEFDTGYMVMNREGGSQIRLYRLDDGTPVQLATVDTTTPAPADGALFWYRVTITGTSIKVYNSSDGVTWTEQINTSDSSYSTGSTYLGLYNGLIDKAVTNSLQSHCNFEEVTIVRI